MDPPNVTDGNGHASPVPLFCGQKRGTTVRISTSPMRATRRSRASRKRPTRRAIPHPHRPYGPPCIPQGSHGAPMQSALIMDGAENELLRDARLARDALSECPFAPHIYDARTSRSTLPSRALAALREARRDRHVSRSLERVSLAGALFICLLPCRSMGARSDVSISCDLDISRLQYIICIARYILHSLK